MNIFQPVYICEVIQPLQQPHEIITSILHIWKQALESE